MNARKYVSRRRSCACLFEGIESRQMMSSTLGADGTLVISGTANNDTINITRSGNTLKLRDNAQTRTFVVTQVRSIIATLGAGNDTLASDNSVTQPMTISGGAGNDTISGGAANDQFFGQEGDDTLIPSGRGADVVSGGEGSDTVSYGAATSRVNVTLDDKANDGLADGSTVKSKEFDNIQSDVENLIGSPFADFLSCLAAPAGPMRTLNGMGANDCLLGGDGPERMFGDTGNDTLLGQGGNDSLWGGSGSDWLTGGDEFDEVHYDEGFRRAPVQIILPNNSATSGAEKDMTAEFEAVFGTRFGDRIVGNDANNLLVGMGGNDFISGGLGNDTLHGNDGDDVLHGQGGNDFIHGGAGADNMSGGDGWDDVRYDDAFRTTGVLARIPDRWEWSVRGNGQAGENDAVMHDFEAIVGTAYNDVLTGNLNANYLIGLGGNDILAGRAGNDTIDGGAGADMLFGDEGHDLLLAKDGAYGDRLDGGDGWDTAERDRSALIWRIDGARSADSVIWCETVR
jgi:Ca2+-binding RTX toxin-like protein